MTQEDSEKRSEVYEFVLAIFWGTDAVEIGTDNTGTWQARIYDSAISGSINACKSKQKR